MRLWSINPLYLDQKGLCGCWREALLCQHVLLGKTKGYTKHPQLIRFKNCISPIEAIGEYLTSIWKAGKSRFYNFDSNKIVKFCTDIKTPIIVTDKQLEYEFHHLQLKLVHRDRNKWLENHRHFQLHQKIYTHPMFIKVPGAIESWEKISLDKYQEVV